MLKQKHPSLLYLHKVFGILKDFFQKVLKRVWGGAPVLSSDLDYGIPQRA